MKKALTVILVVAFAFTGVFAQNLLWQETFDNDATPNMYGQIICDYTWQWWAFGTAYASGGSLVMQGDYANIGDPLQLQTCWMETSPLIDTNITINPEDYEIYVRLKIESTPADTNDIFHVGICGDVDFLTNFNAYTAMVNPYYGTIGIYFFQTEETWYVLNSAVTYDQFFWIKAKVEDGTTLSVWAYPDGGTPAETPDVQIDQTTVTDYLASCLLIDKAPHADHWTYVSDVEYYEPAPEGWQETFDNDATPNIYGQIVCDYTWQWWVFGTAYTTGGNLLMQGDYANIGDPLQLQTCWMETSPLIDTNITINPEDYEIYVRLKIESTPADTNDIFHVGICGDVDFLTNFNAYTAMVNPYYGTIGIYFFQTEETWYVLNSAVTYDQFFWIKAKVEDGTTLSVWAYPDGGTPAETPDVQIDQTTVTDYLASCLLIDKAPHADHWAYVSDVYYNQTPSVGIDDSGLPELPEVFVLRQNYPNPFNPVTAIKFDLAEASDVNLVIYDLLGHEVATLVNDRLNAGYHNVVWNGTDSFGKPVSTGMYIYRVTAGDLTSSKKMLLLK